MEPQQKIWLFEKDFQLSDLIFENFLVTGKIIALLALIWISRGGLSSLRLSSIITSLSRIFLSPCSARKCFKAGNGKGFSALLYFDWFLSVWVVVILYILRITEFSSHIIIISSTYTDAQPIQYYPFICFTIDINIS